MPEPLLPLVCEGLAFVDEAGEALLRGVNLTIGAGTRTIIMGPNGAGKSLLMRIMHGLVAPTAGRVTWAGRPMTDDIARRQAFVFQRPTLLRRSVAENIAFVLDHLAPATRADAVDAALARARLAARRNQPARLLSGGEQQRLALARALALEPEVLFLDEPTASLDPASTLAVEEMVLEAHGQGTKIIMVTHHIPQVRRLADDIVFMDKGRVVECQPARAFFAAPRTEAAQAYLDGRLVI